MFKKNKYNDITILIIVDCHHLTQDEIIKVKDLQYDVCFLLGDINSRYLDLILKYVPIDKIYGILGNHDEYGLLESKNIKNIHLKNIEINGINFLGFEGSNRYKKGNIPMYTQEESIELLKNCDKADVLISHDCPYELYSKSTDQAHCGLKGISEYLKKNRVYLNIHGHQHINSTRKLRKTNVIGIYRCAIIKFPTLEKEMIF